jgi:hypothetical protein
MPNAGGSTYALVIVSLGILGVVVSFLITDRKKYFIGLALSGLIVALGLFQFAGASYRQWSASRRFAKMQETQRLNMEALHTRLREASEKSRKTPSSTPAPAPEKQAATTPAKKK